MFLIFVCLHWREGLVTPQVVWRWSLILCEGLVSAIGLKVVT